MQLIQKRRRFSRILYSPFSVILLAIALFFIVRATIDLQDGYQKAAHLSQQSEARMNELTERSSELEASIASLASSYGQDIHFRKMGFAKPEEGVVSWSYVPKATSTEVSIDPWYVRMWVFFGI